MDLSPKDTELIVRMSAGDAPTVCFDPADVMMLLIC